MKTAVFQSFRTTQVPSWIAACTESVRAWAQQQGFTYRFWDDRFFDLIPLDLRLRASVHKCLLADYARVVAARQLIAEGFERAIWIDADVLVFDPQNFSIPITKDFAFCREVWMDRVSFGRPQFVLTVNNSVSVYCRSETLSEGYLAAAGEILRNTHPLTPFSIGTEWLLHLRQRTPFPLLTNVGIFGPEMARRYLADDGQFLRAYLRYQTSPVQAINLCLSKSEPTAPPSDRVGPDIPQHVVDRLRSDRGASLNRWFDAAPAPRKEQFGKPLSPYLAARMRVKNCLDQLLGAPQA